MYVVEMIIASYYIRQTIAEELQNHLQLVEHRTKPPS
jgi:hypothetical protein